jgi:hypothetical protein
MSRENMRSIAREHKPAAGAAGHRRICAVD